MQVWIRFFHRPIIRPPLHLLIPHSPVLSKSKSPSKEIHFLPTASSSSFASSTDRSQRTPTIPLTRLTTASSLRPPIPPFLHSNGAPQRERGRIDYHFLPTASSSSFASSTDRSQRGIAPG
ncbi:hypothetical protein L1887_18875 [Cichorium endivia]|nr:hypothetical protein L1887_18875 [Cichorium endivia]